MEKIKAWDLYIRVYHWMLVAIVILNYTLLEDGDLPHKVAGYVACGLVIVRIIWGFIGSPYARFSEFFPTPKKVVSYINELRHGRHPRYIGHNPLGAIMMLWLLFLILAIGLTGWLLGTDLFWGSEEMEKIHTYISHTMLISAGIHAAAAVRESLIQKENLILAMIHGWKRKN